MTRAAWLVAAALLAPLAAEAQVRTLWRAGGWSAFGGTLNDGRRMCGVDVQNTQLGKHFMLRFFEGDRVLRALAIRQAWRVPEDAQVPVGIAIEGEAWRARAAPSDTTLADGRRVFNALAWNFSGDALASFERAFRRAVTMRLEFPSGTEAAWVFDLRGSNEIMNAFTACMRAIMPQGSQAPTQPFAPAQPGQPFVPPRPNPAPQPAPVAPAKPLPTI